MRRFMDIDGAALLLGDTVHYTDELGRRFQGVIECPLDFGRDMIRLTRSYNSLMERWEDCSAPVTQYRVLEGCGKRPLSKRLSRVRLISRRADRRCA